MVRWDSPLFTIACDEEPPYEEIWAAITTGEKKKATAAVAVVSASVYYQLTLDGQAQARNTTDSHHHDIDNSHITSRSPQCRPGLDYLPRPISARS